MPHAGFLVKEERKNRNYWSCLSYSTDAMLSWTETGPKTISGPYPCSYFGAGAGAGAGAALVFGSRNRTRIPSQEPEPDPCSYFGPGTAFVFRSRDRTRKTDALGHHRFKFVRTPVLLIAECGAIDPGIRSPVLLNAESGPGGVPRGLGVTLSATILNIAIAQLYL